jgi:elongation factor P hydroxylase
MLNHDVDDLIHLFAHCFADSHNTRLVPGTDEPLYLPAHAGCDYHAVIFAHGFFSSALHECAHWLLAGKRRRQLEDYGYWYVPDGRTAEQQREFQRVEVKPQALEWMLSNAAGYRFQFSHDNLNNEAFDTAAFETAVTHQVAHYQQQGLPLRAQRFHAALLEFYQQHKLIPPIQFSLTDHEKNINSGDVWY